MRTFIIRARKGSVNPEKLRSQIGSSDHLEVIAHTAMNTFFISNGFREDSDLYLIMDSSNDFPRTIHLSAAEGLSLTGFHEAAIIEVIETALKASTNIQKDQTLSVAPGIKVMGFGFEKLITALLETRPVYLLEPKGCDLRSAELEQDPVFILSDHLPLPKNSVKSLKRKGVQALSLGKKMLFAAQCVVLIHNECDRREG